MSGMRFVEEALSLLADRLDEAAEMPAMPAPLTSKLQRASRLVHEVCGALDADEVTP